MFSSSRFVLILQLIFCFFRQTVVPSAPFHSNGQAEFFIMRDTNVNKAFSLQRDCCNIVSEQLFIVLSPILQQLVCREMTGLSLLRQVSCANLSPVTYFIERTPMGTSYQMDAFQQLCADQKVWKSQPFSLGPEVWDRSLFARAQKLRKAKCLSYTKRPLRL